jgi:hypothetical protein
MSKILTTLAVLMLAVAANASAQPLNDYRSPDARPAVVSQDFRSPDSLDAARGHFEGPALAQAPDMRSPDARESGRFVSSAPAAHATTHASSSSFDWAYLAIVITIPLLLLAGYFLTVRRGRDTVAISS